MKICIFGKRVSLLLYEKGLISVKKGKKKKRKENTYHIKKTQPSAYKHMHRYTLTVKHWHPSASCYTPTLTETLTHKHMYAFFTHTQCSHPTDANAYPETHSLILVICV